MSKKSSISFIADDTRFVGDIQSSARLVVEGSVEGNIKCSELTISPSGKVAGNIKAGTVSVAGRYSGSVIAHNKITIHMTGSVEGKIFTGIIVVEEGGLVDGDVKVMTSVEEFPEYTP